MTPNLPINCKVEAILKKLMTASFLVGDFKPKSFDDAKLELLKQFPLIKTDHIAASKTRYSSSTDPQHLYIVGKIAAQAVIPSLVSNLNDIEVCLNCGLSKHSSETCFKHFLHCPLGIPSHKYWTPDCVFKARVLHQSQIARANEKSAK